MLTPLYGSLNPLGRSYNPVVAAFLPSSLSGLQAWYKADAGTYQAAAGAAAVASGDPVGQWQDQSGNNNHAVQTTSGLKPVLTTGALNGKSVVTFTSAAQALLTLTSAVALSDACTIYAVGITRQTGGAASGWVPVGRSSFDLSGVYLMTLSSLRVGDANNNFNDMVPSPAYAAPTSVQVRVHRAGVASNYYTKATNLADVAHAHINTISFDNIGWQDRVAKYTDGDVAEVIVYNRDLTTTEMTQVETYLAGRWAVSF